MHLAPRLKGGMTTGQRLGHSYTRGIHAAPCCSIEYLIRNNEVLSRAGTGTQNCSS